MNPLFGGPGMAGLDPSKLKPETLMKLTRLVQELPPPLILKMQTLMHNAMAGFDVRKEMEEFERGLPKGFREKMAALLYEAHGVVEAPSAAQSTPEIHSEIEARMTILKAVSSGALTPDEAYKVLFES
jgi:hypothetical protein